MSDTLPNTFDADARPSTYVDQQRKPVELAAAALHGNKATLFAALAGAGITMVLVEFDGANDAGQIESLTAYAGERIVVIPTNAITLRERSKDATRATERDCPLPEAIESLAYDLLQQDYDGWEINDGAFGTFTFDVAERSIRLAFNARFSDAFLTEHAY